MRILLILKGNTTQLRLKEKTLCKNPYDSSILQCIFYC